MKRIDQELLRIVSGSEPKLMQTNRSGMYTSRNLHIQKEQGEEEEEEEMVKNEVGVVEGATKERRSIERWKRGTKGRKRRVLYPLLMKLYLVCMHWVTV